MFTMNKETYKKMTGFLHSHPTQAKIVITTNKIITYAIYLAFLEKRFFNVANRATI